MNVGDTRFKRENIVTCIAARLTASGERIGHGEN
jgi:hypothetical protein